MFEVRDEGIIVMNALYDKMITSLEMARFEKGMASIQELIRIMMAQLQERCLDDAAHGS